MDQRIVGFHLDDQQDWVAELACGQDQPALGGDTRGAAGNTRAHAGMQEVRSERAT